MKKTTLVMQKSEEILNCYLLDNKISKESVVRYLLFLKREVLDTKSRSGSIFDANRMKTKFLGLVEKIKEDLVEKVKTSEEKDFHCTEKTAKIIVEIYNKMDWDEKIYLSKEMKILIKKVRIKLDTLEVERLENSK